MATATPSPMTSALYGLKVFCLQCKRKANELSKPTRKHGREDIDWPVVAEIRTKLYTASGAETAMEFGKVQNLRVACLALDRVCVPAQQPFSFWKQLGRCQRRRGYVKGRQLQEGCLVPAIGGGICQLTNSLYQAALQAGIEILERHGHSRAVPGSAAEEGLDATVAWNYVDLRFRHTEPFRLRTFLTVDELVVQIQTESAVKASAPPRAQRKELRMAQSCATCGQAECFRHEGPAQQLRQKKTFVLDGVSPDLRQWVHEHGSEDDTLLVPIDGVRFRKPAYNYSRVPWKAVGSAGLSGLWLAFQHRRLGVQGRGRQQRLQERGRKMAKWLGRQISVDCREVVVSEDLLVHLWRLGILGGRKVTVLASRGRLRPVQAALDAAYAQHPESTTLGDFRVSEEELQAADAAWESVTEVVTSHPMVAAAFNTRATKVLPQPVPAAEWTAGPAILFCGPSVGRKGVYEIAEAARRLRLPVRVMGRNLEGDAVWEGVLVTFCGRTPDALNGCFVAVQPAVVVEDGGRLRLARASGMPTIATSECGADVDVTVPKLNVDELVVAIESVRNASAGG